MFNEGRMIRRQKVHINTPPRQDGSGTFDLPFSLYPSCYRVSQYVMINEERDAD